MVLTLLSIAFIAFLPHSVLGGSYFPCGPDDYYYSFGSFEWNGQTIVRDCEWLARRPELFEQRKTNWCNRFINGALVRDKCPNYCGTCCEEDAYDYGFAGHNCAWIEENPDLKEQRRDEYCEQEINGFVVRDKCRKSCETCCYNDIRYTFGSFEWNGQTIVRDCKWITDNQERLEIRRANWCDVDYDGDGIPVKEKCKKSCNYCCLDNNSFVFGKFPYQGGFVQRTCKWITENPDRVDVRRNKWCNKDFYGDGPGALVKDYCPVACGECDEDDR